MDVAIIIQQYMQTLAAQGYADPSLIQYRWSLERFASYLKENHIHDLRMVSPEVMMDYQLEVMSAPQAARTKAVRIRLVKMLFEYLTDRNRLLVSPAEGIVSRVKENKKIGTVMTREEVKRLLAQPDITRPAGLRDRAIMEVLYATAIRASELRALELGHVDLTERLLYILDGKGGKDRVVPLGGRAVDYVKTYLKRVRPLYSRDFPQEGRLFINQKGRPMTWVNVHVSLYRYSQKARITKSISAHSFRRSAATHLVREGADIRYVQELLGHESLKTTQRYVQVALGEVKTTHKETHPNETSRAAK